MLAVETKSSKLVSHVWKKRYCDKQIFAAFFSRTIMSQKAGKLSKAVPKLSTGAKNVAILKEVGDVSHQLALIKPLKADTKCSPVKQATCQSAKISPLEKANETKKTFTVKKPQNISPAQSSTGFPVSPQTEPSSPVASYNPVRLPKLDDDDYDKKSLHELLDNTVESVPLVSGAIPMQLITEQGITLENRETVGVLTLINLRQARLTTMKVFHCSGGYLCVNTNYQNLKEAGLQPMAGVCRGEQDIQGMMVANTSSELTLRLAIFNEKLAKLVSSFVDVSS